MNIWKRTLNFASIIFTLTIFGCSSFQPDSSVPGIDTPIRLDFINIKVVDARIQNNYSTQYIMHYPPEGYTFYRVTTMIEGFNDPKPALDWGIKNLGLINGNQEYKLRYANWNIIGDDIQYNSDESFDYRFAFFFDVIQGSDYDQFQLKLPNNQTIELSVALASDFLGSTSAGDGIQTTARSTQIRDSNQASGQYAVINGGSANLSTAFHTTVGGGMLNFATAAYGTTSGGRENEALNLYSSVGGGYGNQASGRDSTIGGGSRNTASNYHATIGGGIRNQSSASDSTISGGSYNLASDIYATVSGGTQNVASGSGSVVSGGAGNTANGDQATVGGGLGNQVNGIYATICGGQSNTTSGNFSVIPGGSNNQALGDYSLASGNRAVVKPTHPGSFLFADSLNVDFSSTNSNEFGVRATGGIRLVTGVDTSGIPISGVILPSGSGSWASLSDQNKKENLKDVDKLQILEAVAALPISEWNYISQDPSVRHIGPMAQDFFISFGTGENNQYINSVDADGVTMAAIQGLHQIVEEKEDRISSLEMEIAILEKQMDKYNLGWMGTLSMILVLTAGTWKRTIKQFPV